MKVLVLGDLHLNPDKRLRAEDIPVNEHDLVLSIGDIIDGNRDRVRCTDGEKHERVGKELFETLDDSGVPIVAVPGNHDPVNCTERLTEGLENVMTAHKDCVSISSLIDSGEDSDVSVFGWGCEQLEVNSDIPVPEYQKLPQTDIQNKDDSDVVAEYVEKVTYQYLTGEKDETYLRENLLDTSSTGVQNKIREKEFEESLYRLEKRFNTIRNLMDSVSGAVLVASHLSPFNSHFDTNFRIEGGGQHGLGLSHRNKTPSGSLALSLALLDISPVCVVSGHTHTSGTYLCDRTDTYFHNPGYFGVTSLKMRDGCSFRPVRINS